MYTIIAEIRKDALQLFPGFIIKSGNVTRLERKNNYQEQPCSAYNIPFQYQPHITFTIKSHNNTERNHLWTTRQSFNFYKIAKLEDLLNTEDAMAVLQELDNHCHNDYNYGNPNTILKITKNGRNNEYIFSCDDAQHEDFIITNINEKDIEWINTRYLKEHAITCKNTLDNTNPENLTLDKIPDLHKTIEAMITRTNTAHLASSCGDIPIGSFIRACQNYANNHRKINEIIRSV